MIVNTDYLRSRAYTDYNHFNWFEVYGHLPRVKALQNLRILDSNIKTMYVSFKVYK